MEGLIRRTRIEPPAGWVIREVGTGMLTSVAERDLDRMDKPTQRRVPARLEQLGANPYDSRVSGALSGGKELRKSRLGGWRFIYEVRDDEVMVCVVMIERRGQVYHRI